MKVLLINPPAENEIFTNVPRFVEEERGCNPPLGLLYVAAYLEERTRHDVRLLDAQVEEAGYGRIERIVRLEKPQVVGVTAMTMTLLDVLKTIETVRRAAPGAGIVLGGPHVHIFPEETIRLPGVDYLLTGEAEETFPLLIDRMGDDKALKNVPGLVYRRNGKVVRTPPRDFVEDLDALPFPARRLTPYWKYTSLTARRSPVTTMFTSRGCPYKCTYCDRPHLGKRFRWRSAANVVDEMEECVRMGIPEILVYDDTFNIRKDRVLEVCREIGRRKLDFAWDFRARVNVMDGEMLRALKGAGCERIHYGVEAGSERILKVLRKGITIEQCREVFGATRRAGIDILAYFMIGNPTETREEILESFRVMRELRPDYVQVAILSPFPATEVYKNALASGGFKGDVWREFAEKPDPSFEPPFLPDTLEPEELRELVLRAYKEFYRRPGYIVRRVAGLRSAGEARRKLKAGLRVLGL